MRVSNPRKRRLYWLLLIIWVAICLVSGVASISAAVGGELKCNNSAANFVQSYYRSGPTVGVRLGQSFTTLSDTVAITAIKIHGYRESGFDASTIVSIEIRESGTFGSPTATVVGSQTTPITSFPIVPGSGFSFSCDPDINPTTVIEFSSPISVTGSTTYSIVLRWDSGPGGSVSTPIGYWAANSAEDSYTGSSNNAWSCNTSCGDSEPAWTGPHSWDRNFVVFDTPEEPDVDTWIPNFLDSLGLNSDMGKLLSGVLFVGTLMFALLNRGVVALMALAVAAMAGTFLVAVMIFDPSILLIMVAIVGLGAMGLIFALFSGAGDNADG